MVARGHELAFAGLMSTTAIFLSAMNNSGGCRGRAHPHSACQSPGLRLRGGGKSTFWVGCEIRFKPVVALLLNRQRRHPCRSSRSRSSPEPTLETQLNCFRGQHRQLRTCSGLGKGPHIPLIPALGRVRQEDCHGSEASLGYMMRPSLKPNKPYRQLSLCDPMPNWILTSISRKRKQKQS